MIANDLDRQEHVVILPCRDQKLEPWICDPRHRPAEVAREVPQWPGKAPANQGQSSWSGRDPGRAGTGTCWYMLVHWSHCIATNPWCSPRLLAHGPIIVWIHILRREEQVALARVSKDRILTNSEDSERIYKILCSSNFTWLNSLNVWISKFSKYLETKWEINLSSNYHQTIISWGFCAATSPF